MHFTSSLLLAGAVLILASPATAVNIFDIGPYTHAQYHITGSGVVTSAEVGHLTTDPFFIDPVGARITVDLKIDIWRNTFGNSDTVDVIVDLHNATLTRIDNGTYWNTTPYGYALPLSTGTPENPIVTDVNIHDYPAFWGMAFYLSVYDGDFAAQIALDGPPPPDVDYDEMYAILWGNWAAETATVTLSGGEVRHYIGPNFQPVTPGVPEPATWAMLILGFGTIGVSVRRRRTYAC